MLRSPTPLGREAARLIILRPKLPPRWQNFCATDLTTAFRNAARQHLREPTDRKGPAAMALSVSDSGAVFRRYDTGARVPTTVIQRTGSFDALLSTETQAPQRMRRWQTMRADSGYGRVDFRTSSLSPDRKDSQWPRIPLPTNLPRGHSGLQSVPMENQWFRLSRRLPPVTRR